MSLKMESAALCDVVTKVFKTMAGIDLSRSDVTPNSFSIAALVGLTSAENRMVVILHMNEGFALKAAGSMLGDDSLVWGPAAEDAVAELANIVAGNLKPHLSAGMSLSLPTVVHGSDFVIRAPRLSVSQSEAFQCMEEPMSVILAREG